MAARQIVRESIEKNESEFIYLAVRFLLMRILNQP